MHIYIKLYMHIYIYIYTYIYIYNVKTYNIEDETHRIVAVFVNSSSDEYPILYS